MFCPAPVHAFDYRMIQIWLKRNCWIDHRPAGECVTTSFFIQVIFGWPVRSCEYHAWNQHPNGLILDLTVGQFRKQHSTRLVQPATIFDLTLTYASARQIDIEKEARRCKLGVPLLWLERLQRQLTQFPLHFGVSQRKLTHRVNEAIETLYPRRSNYHGIALTLS